MGKREKQGAKTEEAEGEDREAKILSQSLGSDDDDAEANEDLSLKIVEKALLKQSAKPENGTGGAAAVELTTSSSLEAITDTVAEGPSGVKKKKKRKKTAKKMETSDQLVINAEKKPKAEGMTKLEAAEGVEELAEGNMPNAVVEEPDNVVLRKLLRGPRYFDPPDSGGWPTCYNCGEEGHMAVNCPSLTKRQKPCFVCGGLGHGAKQCSKAQDCFICKSSGHRAKDCPQKYNQGLRSLKICLKCGSSGHDMFSCKNDYSASDLKGIQCYICNGFGHLCCANDADDTPREFSCYKCGELGHTGLSCSRLREETSSIPTTSLCYKCGEGGHFARECSSSAKGFLRSHEEASNTGSPSLCFKCGGGGHFARECSSSAKARVRLYEEESNIASPSLCYKCGGGGHFARECSSSAKTGKRNSESATPRVRAHKKRNEAWDVKSAPHDLVKDRKRRKTKSEERATATPRMSKRKSKWIAEDPQDLSQSTPRKSKHRGGWTVEDTGTRTPGGYSSHFSNRTGTRTPGSYSSHSSNRTYMGQSGTPPPQKSAPAHRHRFSASRFRSSNNDEVTRNYDLEMRRHYGDGIRRNHDWW